MTGHTVFKIYPWSPSMLELRMLTWNETILQFFPRRWNGLSSGNFSYWRKRQVQSSGSLINSWSLSLKVVPKVSLDNSHSPPSRWCHQPDLCSVQWLSWTGIRTVFISALSHYFTIVHLHLTDVYILWCISQCAVFKIKGVLKFLTMCEYVFMIVMFRLLFK